MKLEVGMYVRTIYGNIKKVINVQEVSFSTGKEIFWADDEKYPNDCLCDKDIVKIASHNIIDLIEVGDYVNGKLVTSVEKEKDIWIGFGDYDLYITDTNEIESIVTKEQFEAMKYEVGD